MYIDTYYLLEMVLKGDKKHDAEKILYKARKGSFELVVPQIVLGEAVSKILKRGKDARRLMGRLVDTIEKYGIDVNVCLAPVAKSAFEIMEEVRRRDPRLDGTDLAILAHALADLKPLGFYSDWEAYHYGPYSMDLTCDLQEAEKTGLLKIESREFGGRAMDFYSLAPRGCRRCCTTTEISSVAFTRRLPT